MLFVSKRLTNFHVMTRKLHNRLYSTLRELRKDIMDNYPLLDRRLKWKAQIVEERLSNEDAFSPHDFFNLGRSAFLPTLASGFTYFIIIVQFKLSEKPYDPSNSTSILENLFDSTENSTTS